MKGISIILPPLWSGVYLNTARLLKYSLEDLGIETSIIEAGEIQKGKLSIVLGWNLIPDVVVLNQPYIIYQLEPLVLTMWQDKIILKRNLFQNARCIWDYAQDNANFLSQFGFKTEIIPLGYHPKLQEVVPEFPDYDVLFVGFLTDRRKKIIEELQQHCCVSIQQRWGKDFSEALGRSKILLNIHQYDAPTPIEQTRISYALNNQTFVLSENSTDNPYPQLITSPYDNIVDKTLHFLKNVSEREKRKNTVFEAFKQIRMEETINLNIEYSSNVKWL